MMQTPICDTAASFESLVSIRLQEEDSKRALTFKPDSGVGLKPDGREFKVDWELIDELDQSQRAIVLCRFKEQSGSTEDKLPFDVIKILSLMKSDSRYKRGWIVLGGSGWTKSLVDFYKSNLKEWIPNMSDSVRIVSTLEELSRVSFSDF
jgi:hypothetical protein